MKIDDAIRKVESIFSDSPNIVSDEDNESVEFALEAMEKQDPMKPMKTDREHFITDNCRMCEKTIVIENAYCPSCGQAIDWED